MSKKILIVTECFYPEEFKINDVILDNVNCSRFSKWVIMRVEDDTVV